MLNLTTKVWRFNGSKRYNKCPKSQSDKTKFVFKKINLNYTTVKPVNHDHPRDPKPVADVDRWSLFRGSIMLQKMKIGLQNGVRCRQVVVIRRCSLTQV